MSDTEKYYPEAKNLGKECLYWHLGRMAAQCQYPKKELEGRTTCGGVIDDVCLYVKDGRTPSEFTQMVFKGIKYGPPDGSHLPPGEIE